MLILVLILQIPLVLPFFHKGFFPSHDDVQVTRVFEMFQSLSFGDFPPRWSANLLYGYGYPLYIFYSPFPYFVGALFSFLGFNFLISTKIVFILSFILGGMGIYLLVKEWWGKLPAVATSIAFSYAPYRAVDVYVRGNLAEFFAFSFFPWVFISNWKLITASKDQKRRWEILLSLTLFVLMTSHNISGFIYLLFLFVFDLFYIFFQERKDSLINVLSLIRSVLLSLLLSSYYLIPLLVERKYVMLGTFASSPYWEYFLTIPKIWNFPWGFGGYLEPDAMSLQLGKTLIVFSFLAVIGNLFIKTKYRKILIFFFFSLLMCTFIEIKQSVFIWQNIKILSFLQFPWRFHILSTFLASILAGSTIFLIHKRSSKLSLIFLIVFLSVNIFENFRYFCPKLYWNAPSVSETTTWNDEYLPKWVKQKPKDYTFQKIFPFNNLVKISNIKWGYLKKEFTADLPQKGKIQIAHVYYPGWEVSIDGNESEIKYDNPEGLMEISVSQGKHEIIFTFKKTTWRFLADSISLAGTAVFLMLSMKEIFKRRFRVVK